MGGTASAGEVVLVHLTIAPKIRAAVEDKLGAVPKAPAVQLIVDCVLENAVPGGGPGEHVAVGGAALNGNAHADAGHILSQHGLKVSGRVYPIRDRRLGDLFFRNHAEAGEVVASAVEPAVGDHGLPLVLRMLSEMLSGNILGGVHQPVVRGKFRPAMLPADLIDKPDHFLPDFQISCQVRIGIVGPLAVDNRAVARLRFAGGGLRRSAWTIC